jgi:hypothetical protein
MIDDPDLVHEADATGFMGARPAGPLMKAADVRIAWNEGEDGRISEVLITDDFDDWRRRNEPFSLTGSACYSDWSVPMKDRAHSSHMPDQLFDPLGTFATMMSCGFSSRRVLWSTLRQFASIDQCQWARRILFALGGEWGERDLDKPVL